MVGVFAISKIKVEFPVNQLLTGGTIVGKWITWEPNSLGNLENYHAVKIGINATSYGSSTGQVLYSRTKLYISLGTRWHSWWDYYFLRLLNWQNHLVSSSVQGYPWWHPNISGGISEESRRSFWTVTDMYGTHFWQDWQ